MYWKLALMGSFYSSTMTTLALILFATSAVVILAGFAKRAEILRRLGLIVFGFASISNDDNERDIGT